MIYDALIVGAGPAGSTAARLLAAAGWSVALVEKALFPRRKVCGEFISATSRPLLDLGDIGGGFQSLAGSEIRRVGLFTGAVTASADMPPVEGGRAAWGRALGREHLDVLLRDAAVRAGATLYQPFKLASLERSGGLHLARIEGDAGDEALSARIVISANGSWERSPLSDPERRRKGSDLLAFKAHFLGSDLPKDLMPLLMFPGGYGGMAALDGGRVSLSCCIRRDVLARSRSRRPGLPAGDAVLAHIREHCEGVRLALAHAELAGPVLAAGPIRPGMRQAHRDGVFRVGNAAGEAHPIIAEGISMAMQSSWLLGRRLIANREFILAGGDTDRIGESYGRDWRRAFGLRLRAAALFAHLAMHPAGAALAGQVVRAAPFVLTWGARLSGKAAGDVARDASFTEAAMQP